MLLTLFQSRFWGIFWSTILGALLCVLLLGLGAAAKPSDPISVNVELGSLEGDLHFHPDQLSFKVGKTYRLHLSNPSPLKHYFTAKDFADAIWTRKVEVAGAEIKGKINNIELKPGASIDWLFRPELAGTYSLECTVPGHAESGMVGSISIGAS